MNEDFYFAGLIISLLIIGVLLTFIRDMHNRLETKEKTINYMTGIIKWYEEKVKALNGKV